jgi:hypothetical protein
MEPGSTLVRRPGMTVSLRRAFAFPRHGIARVMHLRDPLENRGRRECRVQAAPTASCAMKTSTRVSHYRRSRAAAFPARWFTAYSALSPASMTLLVTVACESSPRRLNTSPGLPGPHAFARPRSCFRRRASSALHTLTSTASCFQRP